MRELEKKIIFTKKKNLLNLLNGKKHSTGLEGISPPIHVSLNVTTAEEITNPERKRPLFQKAPENFFLNFCNYHLKIKT